MNKNKKFNLNIVVEAVVGGGSGGGKQQASKVLSYF